MLDYDIRTKDEYSRYMYQIFWPFQFVHSGGRPQIPGSQRPPSVRDGPMPGRTLLMVNEPQISIRS